MTIYTMQMYKGIRMIDNLKWGVRDRTMTQHGAYPNRGHLKRYSKIDLEDLRGAFKRAKAESKK